MQNCIHILAFTQNRIKFWLIEHYYNSDKCVKTCEVWQDCPKNHLCNSKNICQQNCMPSNTCSRHTRCCVRDEDCKIEEICNE